MEKLNKLTFDELINRASEEYGDKAALSCIGCEPITYTKLKQQVLAVSDFLKDQGISPGDKVAILSENNPNWGIAYFAVTSMGAIVVPIMTEFHTTEVHHIIRHSEAKAIFVSTKLYHKIEELNNEVLTLSILIDDFSAIPPNFDNDKLKEVVRGGKKEFNKARIAAMKFVGMISASIKEDDIASILYTSGTTGHSKAVMLTHKNLISNAYATMEIVSVNSSDRMLSILPLSHTYECTLGLILPMINGASVYYLDKPPTAAVLIPAMKKIKPTVMLSVPLVIDKIYRMKILPEFRKNFLIKNIYTFAPVRKKLNAVAGKKLKETFGGELKMFCIGGAALAPDVEKFLREAKFPYAIGYGLTETSPLVTGTDQTKTRFKSAGKVLPGVQIAIDKNTNNGEGEIMVKGPNVMLGYFKDDEATKEVLNDDWFKTGDLGSIDKDGYLFIKGRSKNVIIGPNGKNIYPEQIESVINEFEYVLESLVYESNKNLIARVFLNYEKIDVDFVGLKEANLRQKIKEILDDLHKNVNEKLSTFSRLNKIVEQVEPFEKTPTQKIKRYLYV